MHCEIDSAPLNCMQQVGMGMPFSRVVIVDERESWEVITLEPLHHWHCQKPLDATEEIPILDWPLPVSTGTPVQPFAEYRPSCFLVPYTVTMIQ